MQGQISTAIDMLGHALQLDPEASRLAVSDADLDPLRSEPAFQQLMARYPSNSDEAIVSS